MLDVRRLFGAQVRHGPQSTRGESRGFFPTSAMIDDSASRDAVDRVSTDRCPICAVSVEHQERYPRALCRDCSLRASDSIGRRIEFSNESLSGGLLAKYADSSEPYLGQSCFVDGVECLAEEGRFGGFVLQTLPSDRQRDTYS